MSNYDYIIIGAGASGLLLAYHLGADPFFKDKNILVLDKSKKQQNDRTWCFWEKGEGPFDPILYKTWPNIHFAGKTLNISPEIAPYRYKMLRGIDFYEYYLAQLHRYPNVHFVNDGVVNTEETGQGVVVVGENNTYTGQKVFDSRFNYNKIKQESNYPILQQHFLGWFVKTEQSVFNPEAATFMDFSIPQKGNTRFMYVLPFSATEALIEYTLFSENPLEKSEYEMAIREYLSSKLGVTKYDITETEQGNIPMTCYDFSKENTDQLLRIGISGGWAKASTGYTFYSSVKKVPQLVAHIKEGKPLHAFNPKTRFWYYDLLLLDILHKNNHLGGVIFESLFKRRKPQLIFKFLDEETTFLEDLYIMASPRPWPFIKALLGRLF
ncbi:MAG: lycopene cyclase family protein [Bacteroidota bacterium]